MPRKPRPKPATLAETFVESQEYVLSDEVLEEFGRVESASARSRFENIEPGISVRESMNRESQDFFRWDERTPRSKNHKITACDRVYRTCPPVKFFIDMMTDFVCQGIDIYHPSASIQDRTRHWWKKVNGVHVSDRIVDHLFRHGGVGVLRAFSTLSAADIKDLEDARADDDVSYQRSPSTIKGRIPLRYTILNPTTVTPLGGALAMFAGVKRYGVALDSALCDLIKTPQTKIDKEIVAGLPAYIVEIARSAEQVVPIDPELIEVLYYKKDDWQYWPDPMVMCVYKDTILYNKMKDADRAALDGAISRVRLWSLGKIEKDLKVPPTPKQYQKLRQQLLAAQAGGSIDIIWDAALSVHETSTDVYKFLGQSKYEPSLQAIYAGLGIPQSLTGGGGAGGMTNNALSLKTLIERLQYARNLLIRFWEAEFEKIRLAFGDQKPAKLRFSIMSLSDEAAEKMLWIQLYDRHLLSDETIQERFGELPDIEAARMKRETAQRDAGKRNPRQGAFTEQAGHPDQLHKTVLTQGLAAPSEMGVDLKPKKPGEQSLLDRQEKQALKTAKVAALNKPAAPAAGAPAKKKGVAGEGRPKGKKDEGNRKQRTPKVRQAKASLFADQILARSNLRAIADLVTPAFLASVGKKNLRGLSSADAERLELAKFAHLMELPPGTAFDASAIEVDPLKTPLLQHLDRLNELAADLFGSRGVIPTVEDVREMQVSAYVLIHTAEDDQ